MTTVLIEARRASDLAAISERRAAQQEALERIAANRRTRRLTLKERAAKWVASCLELRAAR